MGNRRKSRELALQALYYMDSVNNFSEHNLALFCRNFNTSDSTLPFLLKLVNGVSVARSEIDAIIERFSSNWKISRMMCVDRNVLRIAVFEMCCCDDIPVKVSINEAIDLGKKFGSDDSGAFINGILDGIRIHMEQEPIHIDISPNSWERINRSTLPEVEELVPLSVTSHLRTAVPLTVEEHLSGDRMEMEPEENAPERRKRRTIVRSSEQNRSKR
jgi:N utilization substance protein B